MLPLVPDDDIKGRGRFESDPPNMINMARLPLIDKEDVRKKAKSKRQRYGYLKDRVTKIIPWVYEQIDREGNWRREITMRARDVAAEFGLEHKSDAAIYSGLRFLLFYEGIDVSLTNNGEENFLCMKRSEGYVGEGFPPSVLKMLDNMELDGWYIKRRRDFLTAKHSIRKEYNKDLRSWTYILESEGNIYFDRRNLTEEQALEFVKYMSGKSLQAPDFVYLTPINIVLNDEYMRNRGRYDNFDGNKVGRELRVTKSGDEFTVMSVYGKECNIYEYDIDSLVKGCSVRSITSGFDKALVAEKVPERVEILKKIIPEINTKNIIILGDKKLVITNSVGTFHISIIDGTLHKIYDLKKERGMKYICVGPICGGKENFIIYNGIKYEVDRTMGVILAKTIMLLEEKYPDEVTKRQILM